MQSVNRGPKQAFWTGCGAESWPGVFARAKSQLSGCVLGPGSSLRSEGLAASGEKLEAAELVGLTLWESQSRASW